MSALVNRSKWVIYSTDDIGPLMYVNRFNGGAEAFYYDKKAKELIVKRRGVYTPHAYIPHDGGRKDKQTGQFYRFHCPDRDYYCSVYDAKEYLPEELPEEFVDCDGFEDASDEADICIQSFIYEVDTNNSEIKLIVDGTLEDFDNINKLILHDRRSDTDIITLRREVVDEKRTYVFIVDLTFGREEFRYKKDILSANDFRKALSSTISALYEYPTFRDIADDLENYL